MYNDSFFPYEKAKLWTGNMILLSLSNFLLYASLYTMLPVLPLWIVRYWYCSYAEAGAAVAVFGLAMFLPGAFNSYLIDTFKRKSVCLIAMFLFVASGLLYPYVATVGWVALVRVLQGALFGIITMTTGSTLVIDVTASRRRTDANIAFAWAGRIGMAVGLALGVYIYPYWNFHHIIYTSMVLGALAWALVLAVKVPFRAPLSTSWFSLDHFLLPRTLWPGLNMMLVAIVFGILAAHVYNELFFVSILIGFILSLLLFRYVLSHTSGRSEVEWGQAAMIGGLLLLNFSNMLMDSYIAGLLLGVGIGTTVSRFFVKMISLPRHCERGTGNNTYQLMWEAGVMGGFLFENMWTEKHPNTIYWVSIGICAVLLLMYEFFTHPWYYRKMGERQ